MMHVIEVLNRDFEPSKLNDPRLLKDVTENLTPVTTRNRSEAKTFDNEQPAQDLIDTLDDEWKPRCRVVSFNR